MIRQTLVVFLLLAFILPNAALARHNRSGASIDRSKISEDAVEAFAVPILFAVSPISENFGDPRDGGSRMHEGLDIFAPKGTPMVSPTEAIVIRTGSGDSAGNYVYTANPGGETFRYMHMDEIANIKTGDLLKKGDFIGTVGDTGNAPDGVYHLHFEVRDEKNEATDPYPKLEKTFTLKEKMSFVKNIIDNYDGDEDEYAEFLVDSFTAEFAAGLKAGYSLPDEIVEALEDKGIVSAAKAEDKLAATLASIPAALQMELSVGDSNVFVSLLQIYLIYATDGPARDSLAAAGPTGYYGGITAAAVSAFQVDSGVTVSGVYDAKTREEMVKTKVTLNIN